MLRQQKDTDTEVTEVSSVLITKQLKLSYQPKNRPKSSAYSDISVYDFFSKTRIRCSKKENVL